MGALSPAPHWLPHDDYVLKSAAEAGASLESLAKGAVQFSRRFTIQELHERWKSLLYDSVVSEQASVNMLQFERSFSQPSKHNNSSFDNDNKDINVSVLGKRQTESVKSCYYSMRKRIRNETFLPSMDMDFVTGCSGNQSSSSNSNRNCNACDPPPLPLDSSLFGISLTDQFGEFEVQLLHSPFGYSPSSEMPPHCNMGNDFMLPVDDGVIIPSEPCKMEDQMGISTPSTDDLLAQIDSILNSTSDDDMFPKDNIKNESYLDTYGSLLLDFPNNGGEAENEENIVLPSMEQSSSHKSQYHHYGGDQMLISSALSVNPACPELRNGVICCTLNTEDPDIPSNDDVFLPVLIPSTPLPSAILCKYDETYRPVLKSAPDIQTNNNGWSYSKKIDRSNVVVPNNGLIVLPIRDTWNAVTSNTSLNEGPKVVISPGRITCTNTMCDLPVVEGSDHTKKTVTIQRELGGSKDTPQRQEFGCPHDQSAKKSMLDQEAMPDDHSDEEIPFFSDVETLILDMDLSPDDKDISFNKKVVKYQHHQAKKTIMRLEQAANAHMQRFIASRGAFGVLYGRHSNHFIKKPEVLVGRGTADTEVDIDLSRECRGGNKVSRRQAIMKINMDGTFVLQNVSKYSIHMNGKEIAPLQSVHLTASSLIEDYLQSSFPTFGQITK
ncbi:unnamed protein product [Cuscuta epithymum]|uniref:FHA domain-containing protein n=1 Tax=Cuscuta epithymum TaxID=186058 RepID=A0AAV0DCR8_9ASTE|nr:unnamed protein product [Cuscuta epithymum]CAH9145967.1 unnamed protein product [Cuscuta epithymum]